MPTLLEPQSTNAEVRLRARLAALEARIAALEGRNAQIPIVTGAPAESSADGSLAVDTGNLIWVRIGGSWRSVAVT